MMGIYSITNSINGKRYIGSTRDVEARFRKHLSQLRNKRHYKNFQLDFDEYGESVFVFEIIEECEEHNLLEREDYFILLYKSNEKEFGYNTNLATRRFGYTHSKETRDKIGRAFKGKKLSEEHKQKISEGLIGKIIHNDETRKRIGIANRRKHMSEETESEIRKLMIEGKMKDIEIANKFGFSKMLMVRIRKELEDEGLIMSKAERDKRINIDLLNGLSVVEIAKKYKITETSVRNKRRELSK